MHDFSESSPIDTPEPRRQGIPGFVWWLAGGAALFAILVCGGVLGLLAYLGMNAPDTSVYTGNRVPTQFIDIAKDVGALEEDEELLYF